MGQAEVKSPEEDQQLSYGVHVPIRLKPYEKPFSIFKHLRAQKLHAKGNATRVAETISALDQLKWDEWQAYNEELRRRSTTKSPHHFQAWHKPMALPRPSYLLPEGWAAGTHSAAATTLDSPVEFIESPDDGATSIFGDERKPSKRKKKKKRKKPKPQAQHQVVGQPAQLLWTRPVTAKPHYHQQVSAAPTSKPARKPVKYVWYKSNALKRKKKEYLNHLSAVVYPFIKFIVFFTVLNPFTLLVFLFSLVSPVVFGFLGFVALSFLVKPGLHLLFDVKRRVDTISHKRWRQRRRHELLLQNRRPITVHKHFYQYQPVATKHRQQHGSRHGHHRRNDYNPTLPPLKERLQHGKMPFAFLQPPNKAKD